MPTANGVCFKWEQEELLALLVQSLGSGSTAGSVGHATWKLRILAPRTTSPDVHHGREWQWAAWQGCGLAPTLRHVLAPSAARCFSRNVLRPFSPFRPQSLENLPLASSLAQFAGSSQYLRDEQDILHTYVIHQTGCFVPAHKQQHSYSPHYSTPCLSGSLRGVAGRGEGNI